MTALPLLGIAAALGSAAAWAVGALLFRRIGDFASPLGMNLGKGLLGLPFLGLALLVAGWAPMDRASAAWLAASGLVGIALGDTLFFMALVRLEARLTLLLATVGQAFTVLLAVVVRGERPSLATGLGLVLVVGGVTWVVAEGVPREAGAARTRRFAGLGWGLLSAACMSVGYLLADVGVERVPTLQATFLRLGAGVAGLAVVGLARRSLCAWLRPFADPRRFGAILLAVLVVLFGGFWLSLVALRHAHLVVASVLMSTEPVFVLPLAAAFRGDRITARSLAGSLLAVAGVAVVVLARTG